MLLWLIEAAGIAPSLVASARAAAEGGKTLMQKAGAIRKVVPWNLLAAQLWSVVPSQPDEHTPNTARAFNVAFTFTVPYAFEEQELEPAQSGRDGDMVPKVRVLEELAAEVRDHLGERFGAVNVEARSSVDDELAADPADEASEPSIARSSPNP